MPLTLLAYSLVLVFMALIMTKRLSPLLALILVPVGFGLLAGFTSELGPMMFEGVRTLAPTGIMLMFAILYFAVMLEAGLFEPFVGRLVALVHGDPVKVVVGSAALALLVSLDGDGSTTYMITVSAMLPLYRQLGLRPLVLGCVTMVAGGVMNLLPWGGPTARAASALALDVNEVFVPMVPALVGGIVWTLVVAWRLGLIERRRLAAMRADLEGDGSSDLLASTASVTLMRDAEELPPRPERLWINTALTVALLAALVAGVLPLPVLFMLAFAVGLLVNYPNVADQKRLLTRHAANALAVAGLIFAAGIFTGILTGTRMVDAIAESVIRLVPASFGPYLAVVTGVLSIPFTFFISNDAFYFGVLPILAKAGALYGIQPVEMARAALVGQPVHLLSPLVPSTYLLVGLLGVEFDEHQKFTLWWSLLATGVLMVLSLLTLVIPFRGAIS